MIDLNLQASVSDGRRRFDLDVHLASQAPIVALYGPSGAGKSLTLQCMAGLLQPQGGHIRVAGRTLFDAQAGVNLPPAQRRVGYLFQDYALFPHLSVRDNVAFGLTSWWRRRLSPAQAQRVDAMLDSFGLLALADSRPAHLSGGQQQRVALARALVCEPAVLLLDEPFAALNPMLRQDLRRELADACRRWNTPALMITHDVDDVATLADVAFVFDQGRVVREVDVRAQRSRNAPLRAVQAALLPELAHA
jgi:molybdate transport system ATP-binding protein